MRSFRRPLDDDSSDHHIHTWAALSFFILSLVTWLLPLSPAFLHSPQTASEMSVSTPQPRFKVDCWCPAQFNEAHVRYTNAICGQSLIMALQGLNTKDNNLASLYHINGNEMSANLRNVTATTDKESTLQEKHKSFALSKARRFMRVTTPIALLLMSLCLRVPVFVRWLLRCFIGGVNVHQTLKSTIQSAGLSSEDRYKLYSDLTAGVANSLRNRPWSSGVLYIFYKILLFIAVIIILVMVNGTLLPQAANLNSVLSRPVEKYHSKVNGKIVGKIPDNTHRPNALNSSEDNEQNFYIPNFGTVLHCDYNIRQRSNSHHYTVQCMFSYQEESDADVSDILSEVRTKGQRVDPPYEVYETLFAMIQMYATILAVISGSSLVVWISRLVSGSCRKRLPLDAVLLLQMARDSAGPEAVQFFSNAGLEQSGKKQEHIALQE